MTYPLFELGIHRIPCPLPFIEAGGPANVYLIEEADGGVALFDTGLGTPEGEQAVRDGFARLGWSFGDVRRIYLSHGHIDHYGLARTVSEESGAEVHIHEADRLKVERPAAGWRAAREAQDEYLRRLGLSAEDLETLNSNFAAQLLMARPVERTRSVGEGDVLHFKHFSATVMHAPGHTPGLTCLYVGSHRVLFSDDHLLERVSPNPLLDVGPDPRAKKFRSLVTYLKTLDRTEATAIDLVLPGHNAPFRELGPLVDRLRKFYEARQARIMAGLEKGARSVLDVVAVVFPRFTRRDLFLMVSEIVGNLEVLEDKGAVVQREHDGAVHWELTRSAASGELPPAAAE